MHTIVGLDEVGRGCLAGPLVAGAVALPVDFTVPVASGWRLADSKLLSRSARQAAVDGLRALEVRYGLGWVPAEELDQVGLTVAVRLAMQRALATLTVTGADIVIDGSYNFLPDQPLARTLVQADRTVPAVSAASIVAKVARDEYMAKLAGRYPQYGFERHVGYGTAVHMQAMQTYGLTPEHRRSFAPVRKVAAAM